MKIYTTVAIIAGPEGKIVHKVDTIEYDGSFWLVPEWLDIPGEGLSMPARIIRLDDIPHENGVGDIADFLLSGPIPKAVCDGQIPPGSEQDYVVIERPNIKVPRTH